MSYRVDKGRVTFEGKAVRGADASTFVFLRGGWGKDAGGVYFEGRKIRRVHADSFQVYSDALGADRRQLVYRPPQGAEVIRPLRPSGLDLARARVVETGHHIFLVTDDKVWIAGTWALIGLPLLEARSFVALGQGYAKDGEEVHWFDPDGHPKRLMDVDAETFTVDRDGAFDRRGRFVADVRDDSLLPVQGLADRERAAETLVETLWALLVQRWFALFDGTLPNDDSWSAAPQPSAAKTPIPPHRVFLADGAFALETFGKRVLGKVSAMELLAGWLFGIARRKTFGDATVIRVLHRADGQIASVEGSPAIWESTLDLAFLFAGLGQHDEARFLVRRVLRSHRFAKNASASSPAGRAQKLLAPTIATLPPEVKAQGTRTQSATKWMLDHALHQSPDALVRRDVAEELYDLVGSTDTAVARLFDVCRPALCLLDDAEPAVVSSAAVAFDYLCSKLFHDQDYEAALELARILGQRGFNLDIQSARQWECLAALGKDAEAEDAWATNQALTQTHERAPRLHGGLHGGLQADYPSFEVWRAFGELRLARSHMCSWEGKHPSDELRDKRPLASVERSRGDWMVQAGARVMAVGQKIVSWVETMPSREIGPVFVELAEELARTTGQGRIEDQGFVMRKQYVDYRRYAIPYTFQHHKLESVGEFREIAPKRFVFDRATSRIVAALGSAFGLEYRFIGKPIGRVLPARISVTRPDGQANVYPTFVFLGLRESFVWKFETEDELTLGRFLVVVELFDGVSPRSFTGYSPPESKERIDRLEQEFVVVSD